MSKAPSKQPTPAEARREGEMLAKHAEALKRANLPGDLLERTKADPGAPFEHAGSFANMRAKAPADWARVKAALKAVGVTIGDLERAMGAGEIGDGKQGRPIEWDDSEPWPEPVDKAALLDALRKLVEHYVDLPAGGDVVMALWGLYTWCFDAFSVCPNLMITAPERESGKTQATELMSWMVRRPKPVSDASAAAIIRGIERDGPTLMFDEAQHFLNRKADDPIRGILLASFTRRFAYVERCVGESNEPRAFSTFAPKVLNGRKLAGLDDMLTSRSIVIPMTRTTRRLPELRDDRDPVGEDLRRQCARWAADNAAVLREADPDMGERMSRAAQVWRPLFAIADAASGDWPKRVREAADSLSAVATTFADGETLGTMLLADVRVVFEAKGNLERIRSKALDEALHALPERPWAAMPKTGKEITAQARGRMLAAYGIHAQTLQFDGTPSKGYMRDAFVPSWNAYLPEEDGDRTVEPLRCLEAGGFDESRTVADDQGGNGWNGAETPVKQESATVQRFGDRCGRKECTPPELLHESLAALSTQPPGTVRAGDAYKKARDGE